MNKKSKDFLSQFSTKRLIIIIGLSGLAPLIILFLVSPGKYSGRPIEIFLILLALFIWGLIGLPMIIRKEAPGLINLRGKLAVLQGLFITFGFWLPVVIIIISIVRKAIR